MPKTKNTSSLLKSYVSSYGNVFQTDGKLVLCKICNKNIGSDKSAPQKSQLDQHVNTSIHLKNMEIRSKSKQQLIYFDNHYNFYYELCDAFVSSDIPLHKLLNSRLKNFFEKHMKTNIPNPSTLRKYYLPKIYEKKMNKITSYLKNKKIWISMDEAIDSMNRSIGNVVVGVLGSEDSKSFLLTTETLEKVNHSKIAQLFDKSIKLIYPDEILYENILLFVTDGASYMIKAGEGLQTTYPKMVHVTCLAHGLHRVSETIRNKFSQIDKLISNVKKVFNKAPARIRLFKQIAHELSLPPKPIITRWGTWLEAAFYYAQNFEKVKEVIDQLDPSEAFSIKMAQILFSKPKLKQDLICILANCENLTSTITRLNSPTLKLIESVELIENLEKQLENSNIEVVKIASDKMKNILGKNEGFKTLSLISKILKNERSIQELTIDYEIDEICSFKYAPITSCEVERTFSKYKSILAYDRKNLLFDNLKMLFICYCNDNLD